MAYSEAQKKAVKKYNTKSYDEIKLRVKKGIKPKVDQKIIVEETPVPSFARSVTAKQAAAVSSTMIFWSTFGFIPLLVLWIFVLDKLNLFVDN